MYSYRDQLSLLEPIELRENETKRIDCPFCGGSKTFSITRTGGYPLPSYLLSQTGHRMGRWGRLRYIYAASASDQGCQSGNQLYVSIGLDDRYLILIVTRCYRDIQEPVTLPVSLTRKPIAHHLCHTRMITGGLPHCLSPACLKQCEYFCFGMLIED